MSLRSACDQLLLSAQARPQAKAADSTAATNNAKKAASLATVPDLSNPSDAVVLGSGQVVPDVAAPLDSLRTTPKKNLIQENIERIKEKVNSSDNYARTEIEQIHRPSGVHTIGRQISSQVSKDEAKKEEKRELNVEKGIVSRAKEGLWALDNFFFC